jgi:hypothetical protein
MLLITSRSSYDWPSTHPDISETTNTRKIEAATDHIWQPHLDNTAPFINQITKHVYPTILARTVSNASVL